MELENDHLTPEDCFEFIDRGGGSGPGRPASPVLPGVPVRAGPDSARGGTGNG